MGSPLLPVAAVELLLIANELSTQSPDGEERERGRRESDPGVLPNHQDNREGKES